MNNINSKESLLLKDVMRLLNAKQKNCLLYINLTRQLINKIGDKYKKQIYNAIKSVDLETYNIFEFVHFEFNSYCSIPRELEAIIILLAEEITLVFWVNDIPINDTDAETAIRNFIDKYLTY